MAIVSEPTMMGISPTFGSPNRFDWITTPVVYTDTETGKSWDINGNPLIVPEEEKGASFAGIVSVMRQPDPAHHVSVIEEHG